VGVGFGFGFAVVDGCARPLLLRSATENSCPFHSNACKIQITQHSANSIKVMCTYVPEDYCCKYADWCDRHYWWFRTRFTLSDTLSKLKRLPEILAFVTSVTPKITIQEFCEWRYYSKEICPTLRNYVCSNNYIDTENYRKCVCSCIATITGCFSHTTPLLFVHATMFHSGNKRSQYKTPSTLECCDQSTTNYVCMAHRLWYYICSCMSTD